MINYAHRGASGYYPENTMLAFEKAVELGGTGIETDVQMTRDGVLVLMHDEMVNRTTDGSGFIKDYSYSELQKLDAGSWFAKEYKDARVPSLEEFMSFVVNKNIIINLELKSGVINYEGLEEKLIDMIYRYGIEDRVILSSFNHYSMVKCKEISKSIKTGLLYMEGLYKPWEYASHTGADALHPYFYAVNREVIEEIKKQNKLINIFTVNDENYMRYFWELKVDGIITNYPDKMKNIMEE